MHAAKRGYRLMNVADRNNDQRADSSVIPMQVMPTEISFFPSCSLRYLAHPTSRLFTKMMLSCPCDSVNNNPNCISTLMSPCPATYSRYQFFVGTLILLSFSVISRRPYQYIMSFMCSSCSYLAQFSSQTIFYCYGVLLCFVLKSYWIDEHIVRRVHGYEKKIS